MAENQDIAVLGFTIKTGNAEAAIGKVEKKLQEMNQAMKDADTLLEQKVTDAMAQITAASKAINAAANATMRFDTVLKSIDNLKAFADATKGFAVDSKSIADAITAINDSRIDSLAKKFTNAINMFTGGQNVLKYAIEITNPEAIRDLQNTLIVHVDSTAESVMKNLTAALGRLTTGQKITFLPDNDNLDDISAKINAAIKPKITFNETGTLIVSKMYTVIRNRIEKQGAIKIPVQFTFSNGQTEVPEDAKRAFNKMEKEAQKSLFDTLQEKDVRSALTVNGKSALNTIWQNALLGSPESIGRIRKVLQEQVGWGLDDVNESLDKAGIHATEYGQLIDEGLSRIPMDAIKQMKRLKEQLSVLSEPLNKAATVRLAIAESDQTDEDIGGLVNGFITRVQKFLPKHPVKISSITVNPSAVHIDPQALKHVVKGALDSFKLPTANVSVFPKTITVVTSTSEIKPIQEALSVSVKNVTAVPLALSVNLSAVAKDNISVKGGMAAITPSSIKIDIPKAIREMAILRLAEPLKVSADLIVKPLSIAVQDGYEEKVKEPISVTSKIKLDPLPSDEIERLDKLVTRLHDVETAYGNIQTIASRLTQTVRELDSAMSAEVKQLIRNGTAAAMASGGKSVVKTDPLRDMARLASEAQKISDDAAKEQERQRKETEKELAELERQAEEAAELEKKAQAWQRLLDLETTPADEKASRDRVESFKKLREEMEEAETASGKYAENQKAQKKEQKDAEEKLKQGFDELKQTIHDETEELKQNTDASRANAQGQFNILKATASTNAIMKAAGVELRTFSWRLDNIPRIQPTTLTDPFVKLKAELGETNSRLVDLSRTFGLYLTGRSIINYFKQAAESANNFQLEIRRIQSLAMDFDFGKLRDGLMDIDARFGNVTHNAQALYWAYSSGVRGSEQDLTKFVEIMSKTGTTIKADVMPTLDAATSLMNAFNLSASSGAEIGDLLFSIIKYGKSNAQQLTTSLGHVVAPAAALNVEMDELGATIATLTKTMKTNRALTYLSNILGRMASPTKEVKEAAAEMGLEFSATAIKAKGFANTLREIREATSGDIGKIARLFPDLRSQRAALTLLGTQFGDFEQQLDNMRNKAGSMEEALSKITDTPEMQLRALKNTFAMISIEAGNAANNIMTLGGVLGPILKGINGLGHSGRAILGNFVAAAAATQGLAMAGKAFAMVQYASLQTSYQMASAAADVHRLELDNALLKERQSLESVKILTATMKQEVAQKQLNDATLRELKTKDEMYRRTLAHSKDELQMERMRMQFVNERVKRGFDDRTAQMGASQSRIAYLGEWLTRLQTGEGQQKIRDTQNLIARLNADLQADRALLQGEQDALAKNYRETIENMVENSTEIRKLMHDAIQRGDIGKTEELNSFYGKIVSTIKGNTLIASQMAQYDTDERILQLELRRYMLAKESKSLVTEENYEHSLLVQWVEDEIKTEKAKLGVMQANLRTMMQSNGVSEETRRLADEIMQKQLEISAAEGEHKILQDMIKTRTDELVGRQSDQVRLLAEAANLAKQVLDADTTDLQTLKTKAEIEMKHAAVLGVNTLNAVRDAFNLQMASQSILMKINALTAERATLIDNEGRMINESEEAAKRVLEIDKEKNELQAERNRLQREFIAQGILAGNQDARNMKMLEMIANGATREAIVDALQRDGKVVSEAIKAMSKDIGKGIFGGFTGGNFMRFAPWAMSAIPGMQKLAMPLSMMSSFNVIGKTATGFSRLTGTLMKTFGITERLQKKGFLSLNATVEDFTKSILKSNVTLKGFKLTMESLHKLGASGGIKSLASSGALAAGGVFALGTVLIAAIAGGLAYALSKTDRGGPFADIAEQIYGLEGKKRQSDWLDARLEFIKAENQKNAEMQIEIKRMIDLYKDRLKDLTDANDVLKEYNTLLGALSNLEAGKKAEAARARSDAAAKAIARLNQEREELSSLVMTDMINPDEREKLLDRLAEIEPEIQSWQRAMDQANAEAEAAFDAKVKGVAEYEYQLLRERLEADMDAAFAPKRDMEGKLDLAIKQVDMSMNRLASLLGDESGLADLTGKTTDDIQNLIRVKLVELSTKKQYLDQSLDTAKKKLEELKQAKKDTTEQQAVVEKLETAVREAQQKYDRTSQNLTDGAKDLYSNLINRADIYVDRVLDFVKTRESNAQYMTLFESVDGTFRTQEENILQLRDAMRALQEDFASGADIFKELNDEQRETIFNDRMKKLVDGVKSRVSKRISDIKTMMSQMNTFMGSMVNEIQQMEKDRFNFRMSSPFFAGMRPQLIRNRMRMLNQMLYGKKDGIMSQRSRALEEAKRLQDAGDLAGSQKKLQEAHSLQQKGLGIEQQRLDLIKLEAEKEKEISSGLYQLANTLRGQFQATSQQAIEADSVEAIRLRSRAFNEGIAPAMSNDVNMKLIQEYEKMTREYTKRSEELKKAADSLTEEIIKASKRKDVLGNEANMSDAVDTFQTAVGTFNTVIQSSKTLIKVKRI